MISGVYKIEREPFRFRVVSRSRPALPHFVDLEANAWNGQCDCEDFTCKRYPAFVSAGQVSSWKTRCWHVERARTFFFETVAPKLARAMEAQGT
jgi:hypothetical protein